MTMFNYKAVTPAGEVISGELDADDRAAALRQLSATGKLPLEVHAAARLGSMLALLQTEVGVRPAANARALSVWLHGLATLLYAGVPQDRAVELTASLAQTQAFRRCLDRIVARIRTGDRLSEALTAESPLLSGADLALLRAGEESGAVAPAIKELSASLKRAAEFREELRSALFYPAVLILGSVVVIAIVIGVVLPAFESILAQTGASLPLPTRILLDVASAAMTWGWLVLLALVGSVIALVLRARDRVRGASAARLLLSVPFVGPILHRVDVTRGLRVLATLLRGGVSTERALIAVVETARNTWIRSRISAVAEEVTAGERLSVSLERQVAPPRPTADLLRIGEENGRLPDMLGFAAELLELQIRRRLSAFLTILAPATTIVVGAIVAAIMIAVFSAILSLNEGILGR